MPALKRNIESFDVTHKHTSPALPGCRNCFLFPVYVGADCFFFVDVCCDHWARYMAEHIPKKAILYSCGFARRVARNSISPFGPRIVLEIVHGARVRSDCRV